MVVPLYEDVVVCDWCKKLGEYANAFTFLPGHFARRAVANLRLCEGCEQAVTDAVCKVAEERAKEADVPDELALARKEIEQLRTANSFLNDANAAMGLRMLPSVPRMLLSAPAAPPPLELSQGTTDTDAEE